MKKTLLFGSVIAALCSASALAADLPVKAPYFKAPVAAPASWTSCYIGANFGYGWQRNEPADPATPTIDLSGVAATGAVGGGQIGCDYQLPNNLVIGIAGMLDGAGVDGSYALPLAYSGDTTERESFRTDWFGTLTARLGYAIRPQALLYVKGGGAWAHTRYTDADPSGTFYPPYVGTATLTRGGWTVGAGAEYAFLPHWSAFVEYDYMDFGSVNAALAYSCGTACGFANPYTLTEKQNLQMVLVGLNYRFGATAASW